MLCACLHKTVNMEVFFVKSNEKHLPTRESTHANVQSCPYDEKSELVSLVMCRYVRSDIHRLVLTPESHFSPMCIT